MAKKRLTQEQKRELDKNIFKEVQTFIDEMRERGVEIGASMLWSKV